MADSFSIERRINDAAYGAKVVLTPAAERGTGMVRRAEELAKKHGWFRARASSRTQRTGLSPANHRGGNPGRRLDHFVTSWGTGGITGVGEVLGGRAPGGEGARGRTRGRGDAAGQGLVARTRSRVDPGFRARRC